MRLDFRSASRPCALPRHVSSSGRRGMVPYDPFNVLTCGTSTPALWPSWRPSRVLVRLTADWFGQVPTRAAWSTGSTRAAGPHHHGRTRSRSSLAPELHRQPREVGPTPDFSTALKYALRRTPTSSWSRMRDWRPSRPRDHRETGPCCWPPCNPTLRRFHHLSRRFPSNQHSQVRAQSPLLEGVDPARHKPRAGRGCAPRSCRHPGLRAIRDDKIHQISARGRRQKFGMQTMNDALTGVRSGWVEEECRAPRRTRTSSSDVGEKPMEERRQRWKKSNRPDAVTCRSGRNRVWNRRD